MVGLALFGLAATNATAALSDDDYVEAAWMSIRFYGAQEFYRTTKDESYKTETRLRFSRLKCTSDCRCVQ